MHFRKLERIREEIHSRAMKHEFFTLLLLIKSKPHVLRAIYNALTGECSASRTTAESEVDARVSEVIIYGRPRYHNRFVGMLAKIVLLYFGINVTSFLPLALVYKNADMGPYRKSNFCA